MVSVPATTTQSLEDDDFDNINVTALNGGDVAEISFANLKELDRLGEGAVSMVTKVENMVNGFIMAKKEFGIDPDPKTHGKILRELQFLRTCHSPNIVSHYEAFLNDSNSTIAIIMEYCEGGSLDVIYKNVHKRQSRIGEKILGKIGDSYITNERSLNFVLRYKTIKYLGGEIKITDFGVLVPLLAATIVENRYYIAPERIKDFPYKVSADVWSLGLTIMEVAQNQYPFPSELSLLELITHIVILPTPTLSEEYEFSEEFKDFLNICLEKDGEKRPTPKQMLDHPFIKLSEQRQVNLELWIKQVWEWDD